uniref:Uncharacterized protein n=1 Tax=Lepeophtheirus salmonis TaxID=72036 RepID=A0A0K2T0I5_LEPSM
MPLLIVFTDTSLCGTLILPQDLSSPAGSPCTWLCNLYQILKVVFQNIVILDHTFVQKS